MKAWLFLAIKDMSKRRRETLMVILAITIGVVGPIFTTALNNGMQNAFVGNAVDVFLGHMQIQPNTGDDVIAKSESVVSKASGIKGIVGVAPRVTGGVELNQKQKKSVSLYSVSNHRLKKKPPRCLKPWKGENSLMIRINMNY